MSTVTISAEDLQNLLDAAEHGLEQKEYDLKENAEVFEPDELKEQREMAAAWRRSIARATPTGQVTP